MEQAAEVYARALFEVASERDILDEIRDELVQFVDVLSSNHSLQTFFFSPYLSTEEKKDGLSRLIDGAEETFINFLETLVERSRMPEIFHIRTRFVEMWDEERKRLPVEVTSAVPLDEDVVADIGERIGTQTGNQIELTTVVDPEIVGGIVLRVGDFILDASIRNRLNHIRKQVGRAGPPSLVKEPLNADQA